ncbi:MAG: acyl carrier protein [Flavipsychrobacter sp.]
MNQQEIIDRINSFMVEDFEVEESAIQPSADLKSTLDLDSLDYIDLVVAIEQNFGFKVKPEDFQEMHTIQDFYDYVTKRLEASNV